MISGYEVSHGGKTGLVQANYMEMKNAVIEEKQAEDEQTEKKAQL